jgi:hypothetical protein
MSDTTDTRNVPPEITNDQLFGTKPVEHMYCCDTCGREFYTFGGFVGHLQDHPEEDDE